MRPSIVCWLLCGLLGCLGLAHALAAPPRPMLAVSAGAGDVADADVGAYWVSEKFDGVRARWDGRELWTRGGHPVAAPDWFVAGWPPVPMDGELWAGRGRFEAASALARSAHPDDAEWRQMHFMVFDLPAHGGRFDARVARMRILLGAAGIAWLRPVPQLRFDNADALRAHLAAVVAGGGEGLMLHRGDAYHRVGRSDALIKLKPHDDAEARVVGYTPGRGRYAGLTGALVVERADGARFRLGSGLSDAERADPPAIGTLVTYRYNGLTGNGLPRFARFLRVRHEPAPPDPE